MFEALSPDDLSNRVIYVKADQFRSSSLYNTLQTNGTLSAILVIDECDLQQHEEFVRSFSARGPRLAVFTLSYDIGRVSPPTLLFQLSPLQNTAIETILKNEFPGLPQDVIHRLTQFADGYPRIATLLGESYSSGLHTSEEFITASDEALISRLIGGRSDVNSGYFQTTRRVLTRISLFQKVGFGGAELREEAQ